MSEWSPEKKITIPAPPPDVLYLVVADEDVWALLPITREFLADDATGQALLYAIDDALNRVRQRDESDDD